MDLPRLVPRLHAQQPQLVQFPVPALVAVAVAVDVDVGAAAEVVADAVAAEVVAPKVYVLCPLEVASA